MRLASSASSSYVDPSSLSLPSPSSEASSSESPAPPASSTSGPPRKRARIESSPEEKREARAHRNRIAAQNSRDRRKQQFVHLEEKVRTLQQENEQLRAELHRERERRDGVEKERENAELKERVKSLEQGWEAVLKALQTQGLPSSVFANAAKSTEASPPSTSTPANDSQPSQQPPTTAFPVFSTTAAVLPSTPMSAAAPAVFPVVYQSADDEPTRHLARVANAASPAASLQRGLFSSTATAQDIIQTTPMDADDRIEDWFRDVLASTDDNTNDPSTTPSTVSLPFANVCAEPETTTSDLKPFEFTPGSIGGQADDMDMEMDRLLKMLPSTGDEFQSLLSCVLNDGKVSDMKNDEEWDWDLVQPSVAAVQ